MMKTEEERCRMRIHEGTMSVVQNVVKTLSSENPNNLQAIGKLGTTPSRPGLQGETQVTNFDQTAQ